MKKRISLMRHHHAVSEVVSVLLTLMIVLGAIAVIMVWGLPYIEESKMKNQSQNTISGFDLMYNTLSSMIIEGTGSRGASSLVNANEKGSLTINSYGETIIVMYSYTKDYDFNVSGLDDDDKEFSLISPSLTDKLNIYWLSPETTIEEPAITALKMIYLSNWCAQEFVAPESWTLEKVRINISKNGDITSPLNVSIYNDSGSGKPDTRLTSILIPSNNISTSSTWIDCNLSKSDKGRQTLENGKSYYVVLNTSEGYLAEGTSAYYGWFLDKMSPYDQGVALTSLISGASWNRENEKYDFPCRFFYIDNKPPSTPHLRSPDTSLSGQEVLCDVSATDPDPIPDNVKYRVIWGDGNISDWIEIGSGIYYTFKHPFSKPGVYTITAQAKDIHGNINQTDNSSVITLTQGDYLPDDTFYSESYYYGGNPIITNRELQGTIRIDLFNNTYNGGILPIAKIWKFNLGSILFNAPYSIGYQNIIFENGAVLTAGFQSNTVESPPSFFESKNGIGFRIIQIGGNSSVSGTGKALISMTLTNSFSREPAYPKVYNFKLQFNSTYNEIKDLWMDYFTSSYNFTRLTGPNHWEQNTLMYDFNGRNLVFDNSFIIMRMEGYY